MLSHCFGFLILVIRRCRILLFGKTTSHPCGLQWCPVLAPKWRAVRARHYNFGSLTVVAVCRTPGGIERGITTPEAKHSGARSSSLYSLPLKPGGHQHSSSLELGRQSVGHRHCNAAYLACLPCCIASDGKVAPQHSSLSKFIL
jgi:hypothetical protein